MQLRSEKLLPLCTRPAGYYSEDMDGDGDVEIPSTSPMVGYENAVADEMLYMTTWSVYEDFYDLKTKYTGYYAISDGYLTSKTLEQFCYGEKGQRHKRACFL